MGKKKLSRLPKGRRSLRALTGPRSTASTAASSSSPVTARPAHRQPPKRRPRRRPRQRHRDCSAFTETARAPLGPARSVPAAVARSIAGAAGAGSASRGGARQARSGRSRAGPGAICANEPKTVRANARQLGPAGHCCAGPRSLRRRLARAAQDAFLRRADRPSGGPSAHSGGCSCGRCVFLNVEGGCGDSLARQWRL